MHVLLVPITTTHITQPFPSHPPISTTSMALDSTLPRSDVSTSMSSSQYPRQTQVPVTVATPNHSESHRLNGGPPPPPQSTEGTPGTRMDQPTMSALDILRGIGGQLALAFYSLKIRYPPDHPALRLMGALQQNYITTANAIYKELQATNAPQTAPPRSTAYVLFT